MSVLRCLQDSYCTKDVRGFLSGFASQKTGKKSTSRITQLADFVQSNRACLIRLDKTPISMECSLIIYSRLTGLTWSQSVLQRTLFWMPFAGIWMKLLTDMSQFGNRRSPASNGQKVIMYPFMRATSQVQELTWWFWKKRLACVALSLKLRIRLFRTATLEVFTSL